MLLLNIFIMKSDLEENSLKLMDESINDLLKLFNSNHSLIDLYVHQFIRLIVS